jgi:hypothetical protein
MKKDKSKKIKFLALNENAFKNIQPPIPAAKAMPEWYRVQPGLIEEKQDMARGIAASTIKRCMPIFDMLTAGYIITTPCDIFIDATDPEKLVYSVPVQIKSGIQSDLFATHAIEQYQNYPIDKEKYHKNLLRLHPLWAIETPEGYSTLVIQPHHRDHSPLVAFAGIVDTDKFATDGHFSFLVEKNFKGIIKQGTPLVQVIPFDRQSWEGEVVEYSEAFDKLDAQRFRLRSVFVNGYKNKYRQKKDFH